MLAVAYDWSAIITDALMTAHLNELWAQNWQVKGASGHVVCSSLAAYLYGQVGLNRPTIHEPRFTTPADWELFILQHDYADLAAPTPA